MRFPNKCMYQRMQEIGKMLPQNENICGHTANTKPKP